MENLDDALIQLLLDPNSFVLIISVSIAIIFWWIINNWNKITLPYEWLMNWYKKKKRKDELLQMLLDDHKMLLEDHDETVCIRKEVNEYKSNRINDRAQSFEYQQKWFESQEALSKQLAEVIKQTKDISEQVLKLSNKVNENRKEADLTRIKEIRSRILDFANTLPKSERSIDELEEIFDLHDEYEVLLEKYNQTNGRTTRAMEVVETYYDRLRGLE